MAPVAGAFVCDVCGAIVRLAEFTGGAGPTTVTKPGVSSVTRHRYARLKKDRPPNPKIARDAEIVRQFSEERHHVRTIAAAHGLTRRRVMQIILRGTMADDAAAERAS